jgi:hypothetical protein
MQPVNPIGDRSMNMQWVDELPGQPPAARRLAYKPREGSADLYEHAAELVRYPMRWARYPRHLSARQAKIVADRIGAGTVGAYNREMGFEAVLRSGEIYVRHNPAYVNPARVAFYDGYHKGVRETIEKVRAHLYTFRTGLAEIDRETAPHGCTCAEMNDGGGGVCRFHGKVTG